MNILELSKNQEEYLIHIRRYLHQFPEVGFHEKQTSLFIQSELSSMNIPFEIVGDYGVVATIEGQHKNKMVALRADIDALPIEEQNTHLDYVSKNKGIMHACGHDVHTAMLLLGTGDVKKDTEYDYHHPKFNIDEDSLVYGTALHCQYAIDSLE